VQTCTLPIFARLEAAVEPEDDPGGCADAADVVAVGGPAHPADLRGAQLPAAAPRAHAEAPRDAPEELDAVFVARGPDERHVARVLRQRRGRPVDTGMHAVRSEERCG